VTAITRLKGSTGKFAVVPANAGTHSHRRKFCERYWRRGLIEKSRRMGPCGRKGRQREWSITPHPDRRLLVFCVMLPWSPCSRMLFFSSSRWPLVVSTGTLGALPGPLWLRLSSGMGGVDFAIMISVSSRWETTSATTRSFPAYEGGALSPAAKGGLVRRQRKFSSRQSVR
jgi:hypothetical protein